MLTMLIALQAEILRGSSSHAPPAADSVMPMAPPAADSLVPIAPPADDSDGHIAGPAADSDDEVASSAADSDDEIDPPAADSDDEIAPPAADSDEDIHSPAADSWGEIASPAADSDDDIAPPPPASEVSRENPAGKQLQLPTACCEARFAAPPESRTCKKSCDVVLLAPGFRARLRHLQPAKLLYLQNYIFCKFLLPTVQPRKASKGSCTFRWRGSTSILFPRTSPSGYRSAD